MADIVDQGNDRMQEIIDDAIAVARRGPKGEPGVGFCLNCGEAIHDYRRWCDILCRDDWQERQ